LIQSIEEKVGKKARIDYLPSQPGDVQRTFADIRKAGAKLGYRPRTGIQEGLTRFVRWYLD
jgi:UDP-glucuronate 4-epimerase